MDAGNLLAKAADNLSVRRAFGAAYEKDGMLIIPVAMVAGGAAREQRIPGAVTRPPVLKPARGRRRAHDAAPQDPGRTDAGGGFGGLVLPSGAYVVNGDQVRWVPAIDVTIIVLAR